MTERRTVGQILMNLGRITEQDVTKALEYQRDHGGYFGEALVASGSITQDELEYSLASQFDLPYVFPDADSIDPEAAALVSPEWALAHLTLPILKAGNTLTVIVESPMKTQAVDDLHARTDLEIELALAPGGRIRELIRQVYARGAVADAEARHAPVNLTVALDSALEALSSQFGVSTRGKRSTAWWDDAGTIQRRPLEGDWGGVLRQVLDPSPDHHVPGQVRAKWEAELNRAGVLTRVEVMYLSDESGHEYLFRPRHGDSELRTRFPPPSAGVLAEIRMLARSGSARFVVGATPDELGHEIIPHLPALLLDPSWRSIYINADTQDAANEAFSLHMPPHPETWAAELDTLRAFHFDVVTVDLSGNQASWASSALDVAAVAFLYWPEGEDTRPAYDAGIRWHLKLTQEEDGGLDWALLPLHG